MILDIDTANGLAIYQQVVRQLKFAVASGKLRRGELVPSVRELSKQLAINPKSAQEVYGLGMYAAKRALFDQAERDFEQAVRLDKALKEKIPPIADLRHLVKLFRGKGKSIKPIAFVPGKAFIAAISGEGNGHLAPGQL